MDFTRPARAMRSESLRFAAKLQVVFWILSLTGCLEDRKTAATLELAKAAANPDGAVDAHSVAGGDVQAPEDGGFIVDGAVPDGEAEVEVEVEAEVEVTGDLLGIEDVGDILGGDEAGAGIDATADTTGPDLSQDSDTATCSDGDPCDDGDPCTAGDVCTDGTCAGATYVCECTVLADCIKKDDGNLCNGTLVCDQSTTPFKCKLDLGSVKTCDTSKDGACKVTACVPATGKCVAANAGEGNACDADGNACTAGDVCKGGVCLAGSATSCDDGNVCTADGCDKAKGCAHTAVADGTKCAEGQCTGGACKPLAAVKVWPFGADGDLVFGAPNVITLDADSREPPIWDFAKCSIGGTLKIVGKKPWVLIGCAGDAVIDGTIDMQASYDVADYKDSQQPDAQGKLTGAKLKRGAFVLVGGAGGGFWTGVACPSSSAQSGGNGGGGAGGIGYSSGAKSCGTVGGSGIAGSGGVGGKGANGDAAGGKGGTAKTPAGTGTTGPFYSGISSGGGGGGGGFRGATSANLYFQAAGTLSGSGEFRLLGQGGGVGGSGGYGISGIDGHKLTEDDWPGRSGGGGGGGAGGALVLRTGGPVTFALSSQVIVTGGKGGSGGNPGQPGPPGYVDYAYQASPGGFGSACGSASPCANLLSCQPLSTNGLCSTPSCTADSECKFGQAPLGKCIALAAAPLNGAKTCFPPCSATMACSRSDFTCDLSKGACVPDCRVQSGGFCPNFKTCDSKTGLCADVPCSGTCSAGSICWSNPCSKQVCAPDCTAAVTKACAFDVDCPSGVCLAGQCVACPAGTKCQAVSKVCVADGAAVCWP